MGSRWSPGIALLFYHILLSLFSLVTIIEPFVITRAKTLDTKQTAT